MLSQGVLETLQAQRVICANTLGRGCGSQVLSSQSPSALSPRVPLPWTLGLTPQGPTMPWGSLVSCLLCSSPACPLSQFLHFRPHGWDKPGSLDTWQAEGPPPSWSSRRFCGLGLATAHSCASSTLHNFCWVRGQMHTQPHMETHGFAECRRGVRTRGDALSPHVPAAPESSAL